MNERRWSLVVAMTSALIARLIAHYALGDVPHALDEIAYVFQAKTYLSGHVSAPVSLPRAAFALWFVDDRTSKYGIFPPGWPAIMALGALVHLRAWVNPILHGLTTWIVAKSAERIGGSRARILTALVYGLFPLALFLAASLRPSTFIAFGAACALSAGISANTVKISRFTIAIGGVGVAVATLSDPVSGIVVAIGFGALLLRALRRKKIRIDFCVAAAIPVMLGVVALGAYNRAVTGDAALSPERVWLAAHPTPRALSDTAVGAHFFRIPSPGLLDDRFVRVEQKWNHGTAIVMLAFRNGDLRTHAESALTLNDIDTQHDRLVFAKFHPALVSELRDRYPNRALYMYLVADLPANDVLEPYSANAWADPDAPKPADDFDGYVVP